MHVETLSITNLRAIDNATLRFKRGFNLIVGVNGVGKTTALDALSCALSHMVREVNGLKLATREPSQVDIRFGSSSLTVECTASIHGASHTYLIHEPRAGAGVAQDGEGKPREQTHDVSSRREFLGAGPRRVEKDPAVGRPIGVLFSTRRASAARSEARARRAVGGVAAGFAEALEDRDLALHTFAEWMRAQEALRAERPESGQVLDAFEAATRRFLPGYFNLRVDTGSDGAHRLLIDRGQVEVVQLKRLSDAELAQVRYILQRVEGWLALSWSAERQRGDASPEVLDANRRAARQARIEQALAKELPTCRNLQVGSTGDPEDLIERLPVTLPVTQLSDGERGTLAMVLDLTRRLAQANPHLADPAAEAEAVVLIDEIDLHLHPRWQREVIHSLTTTFPRCQFIATTHSPQVISEVTHDRIQILTPEGVYSPSHSYGIDSSRILEEILDVSPRPKLVEDMLRKISALSHPETMNEARAALDELARRLELGESDPDVVRFRTLLELLEDA